MPVYSIPMDLNSLLLMFGIASGIFLYWKRGGNQANTDILSMYRARDELQDKERKEMKDQIINMTTEIGRLTGLIEEKDKRIAILESVDISKNPVIDKIAKAASESEEFIRAFRDLPRILSEINKSMHSINEHMAKNTER